MTPQNNEVVEVFDTFQASVEELQGRLPAVANAGTMLYNAPQVFDLNRIFDRGDFMSKLSIRNFLTFTLTLSIATSAIAAKKHPVEPKGRRSGGSSVTTTGTGGDGISSGKSRGHEHHDSPRGGQYEDNGNNIGGFLEGDGGVGALGLFKGYAAVNMAAFTSLRNFVQSLSTDEQAQFRDVLTAGAVSAGVVLGARALLAAGKLVKGATLVGALATVSATASAEDVIFDNVAFEQDPYLFLTTTSMNAEDLALWARSYQLEAKLSGLIDHAAIALCGAGQEAGAEQFCSAL